MKHVLDKNNEKGSDFCKPKAYWEEVKDLGTIGFQKEYTYLAAALDDFLIKRLNPIRNTNKKRPTA